jgi:hypothetical protein
LRQISRSISINPTKRFLHSAGTTFGSLPVLVIAGCEFLFSSEAASVSTLRAIHGTAIDIFAHGSKLK